MAGLPPLNVSVLGIRPVMIRNAPRGRGLTDSGPGQQLSEQLPSPNVSQLNVEVPGQGLPSAPEASNTKTRHQPKRSGLR